MIADISKWQGNVDWSAASKELELAILRASCGQDTIDAKYLRNVEGCVQYNVPFGAYHYVKAGTAEEAKKEAQFFVLCANKAAKRPSFFIADIEYEAQTKETTEAVCTAFLSELRKQGCEKIGLYINTRYKWAGAAIDMCDIMWIPHWGKNDGNVPADESKPKYPHDIWQYTSKGRVSGISGNVDMNQLSGNKPLEYFTSSTTTAANESKTNDARGDSAMFTSSQFVEFCLAVYAAKWVYWYGTCGYKCTTSLFNSKKKQYPSHYTSSRESGYKKDIANSSMCADCVGLIKAFFWKGGTLDGTNKYASNGCKDTSANGMYQLCEEKGPISTIPDIPGIVVWKSGHIGVYVGNGYTVEMRGFAYDCVKRKVSEGPWTNWGKLPSSMLSYTDDVVEVLTYNLGDRTLQNGDEGDDVSELQTALVSLGYDLGTYGSAKNGIDGEFGSKTTAAVKALQEKAGLSVTGIFDASAYKALLEAQTPTEDDEEPTDSTEDTPDDGSKPAYVLIIEGSEDVLKLVQLAYGGTLAAVDSVLVKD